MIKWEKYKELTLDKKKEYVFKFGKPGYQPRDLGYKISGGLTFPLALILNVLLFTILLAFVAVTSERPELISSADKVVNMSSLMIMVCIILIIASFLVNMGFNIYEAVKESNWLKQTMLEKESKYVEDKMYNDIKQTENKQSEETFHKTFDDK